MLKNIRVCILSCIKEQKKNKNYFKETISSDHVLIDFECSLGKEGMAASRELKILLRPIIFLSYFEKIARMSLV